jgi:hypothetical protein
MSTLKASSSFQARGRVTGFQAASSKSGFSGPGDLADRHAPAVVERP